MTPKGRRILRAIAAAAASPGGASPTIDELVLLEGRGSSKQAMQHTLRDLEESGFLRRLYERRGERVHLVVELTPPGVAYARALNP